MHGLFNPAQLVLARCPVTKYRVNVAVNQARADATLLRVDDGDCVTLVAVFGFAHSNNQPVVDDDGVCIKNRLANIARQQQANVLDDDFAGYSGGLQVCHGVPVKKFRMVGECRVIG